MRLLWALLLAAIVAHLLSYWLPVDPPDLPSTLPAESVQPFIEAEAFLRPLLVGRFFSSCVSVLCVLLLLALGIADRVEARYGGTRMGWPARFGFLAGIFLFVFLVYFPSSIMTYLHNRSFGITGIVWSVWLKNLLLGLPVGLLLFLFRYILLYCLIGIFKRTWWLYGALMLFLIFSVIPEWVSRTYPLDPIEEMQPLPEGDIRDVFEELAEVTGRKLELMMLDESERTRRVNMALTGRVGREYVLVTDTLLNELTPGEARVMLAHELGHHETRHITLPLRKVLGLINSLLVLGLVYVWQRERPVPQRRMLTVLLQVMLVGHFVSYLLTPVTAAISRFQEREADTYALELTSDPESMISLLYKLAAINLEPYDPPRWAYYLYGSSHPTIHARVTVAEQWEKAKPEARLGPFRLHSVRPPHPQPDAGNRLLNRMRARRDGLGDTPGLGYPEDGVWPRVATKPADRPRRAGGNRAGHEYG